MHLTQRDNKSPENQRIFGGFIVQKIIRTTKKVFSIALCYAERFFYADMT